MDTLFNRRKTRSQARQASTSSQDLDEHSVPYDKLASPLPLPIGTTSQGLRAPNISAPITNPTLTANGMELNKFALQRSKAERDRAYARQLNDYAPPGSPTSTFINESHSASSSVGGPSFSSPSRHMRSSEASLSSASSSLADFGQIPPQNSYVGFLSSPGSSLRPTSGVTSRLDTHRTSKHTGSLSSSDSQSHQSPLSQLSHFHLHNRHSGPDDFHFPRPENEEEIQALFENVKRTRDFPDMPNLSIDQKWHMVYNDEHIRWKERDDQAKRQVVSGQPPTIEGSPEWYIKKFLDKTITAKQAGSLLVSLRSKEMRFELSQSSLTKATESRLSWFRRFVSLRGTSVLAQTLMHISRKGAQR
jgi:cytokinesis protein